MATQPFVVDVIADGVGVPEDCEWRAGVQAAQLQKHQKFFPALRQNERRSKGEAAIVELPTSNRDHLHADCVLTLAIKGGRNQ